MYSAPPSPSLKPCEQGGSAVGIASLGVLLPFFSAMRCSVRPKSVAWKFGLLKFRICT